MYLYVDLRLHNESVIASELLLCVLSFSLTFLFLMSALHL